MRNKSLPEKYTPSRPCSCKICLSYCIRPGWWTVEEAKRALDAGYSKRMMLEMSPEMMFGVLSPAFKGNEGMFALNQFAGNGCTFLKNDRCELFGSGLEPLECRYCHHDRRGMGKQCHSDIEKDWNSALGKELVTRWLGLMNAKP